jgi:hypothetical protein
MLFHRPEKSLLDPTKQQEELRYQYQLHQNFLKESVKSELELIVLGLNYSRLILNFEDH